MEIYNGKEWKTKYRKFAKQARKEFSRCLALAINIPNKIIINRFYALFILLIIKTFTQRQALLGEIICCLHMKFSK
jgi:hypothetical protein